MADRLLLAHTSTPPARVLAACSDGPERAAWLFLGQNYADRLRWESGLDASLCRLDNAETLAAASRDLRPLFLEAMTDLGRRYQSLAWWASRVSERNTAISPLFLHCCYLESARRQFAVDADTLAVICESWEVLETLAEMAYANGRRVRRIAAPPRGRRMLALWVRRLGRLAKFLWLSAQQSRPAAGAQAAKAAGPSLLLRTYVDEACFGPGGTFHDRYFPGLAEWLEAAGWQVTVLPVLFNLRRSYHSAWTWLRRNRRRFLNPYQFYRPADYAFAMREAWRQRRLPDAPVFLGGLDVTRLFAAERDRTLLDVGVLESLLACRLPLRLAQAGLAIDLFIGEFENMIPEKPLIMGFRRYLPNTRLVGYQHGALYPMLLCNFVTAGEAAFAPLPDRVVCNGAFFRDVLVRAGLPADRAVVGPALRYAHLWHPVRPPAADQAQRPAILIPLPLMRDAAAELLTKAAAALREANDVSVLVKPHPMSALESLLRAARLEPLPAHFAFVDGKMGEWLARSRLVIALSSSTLHEALAAGLPVVVVGRETAVELNPLAWFDDLPPPAYTPEAIRAEVRRLLNLSPDELARYRQRARAILASSFEPVTDERLTAFVDGLLPRGRPARAHGPAP